MTLAETRDSWHRVAEHVLAAAQYAETGKIGLGPAPGGFGTRLGSRQLRVDGIRFVVGEQSVLLTTIRAAAELAGIEPGMPASVYQPATPLDLDAPLRVDAGSARLLADWYALADEALREFGGPDAQPILWPEHFDVGITVGAVNFGASPGDDYSRHPYLYVGPHAGPPAADDFWNAPFGAARTISDITSADAAVEFFGEGSGRVARTSA